MNYSELLQLAKSWGNFISDRIIIWRLLLTYLVAINFVTFAAFAIDKIAAIEGKSRIRIVTLLGLSFAGGSIGALIAMYLLRHKTRKDYFTVGVPLTIVMQVVVIFFLMNMK